MGHFSLLEHCTPPRHKHHRPRHWDRYCDDPCKSDKDSCKPKECKPKHCCD